MPRTGFVSLRRRCFVMSSELMNLMSCPLVAVKQEVLLVYRM